MSSQSQNKRLEDEQSTQPEIEVDAQVSGPHEVEVVEVVMVDTPFWEYLKQKSMGFYFPSRSAYMNGWFINCRVGEEENRPLWKKIFGLGRGVKVQIAYVFFPHTWSPSLNEESHSLDLRFYVDDRISEELHQNLYNEILACAKNYVAKYTDQNGKHWVKIKVAYQESTKK